MLPFSTNLNASRRTISRPSVLARLGSRLIALGSILLVLAVVQGSVAPRLALDLRASDLAGSTDDEDGDESKGESKDESSEGREVLVAPIPALARATRARSCPPISRAPSREVVRPLARLAAPAHPGADARLRC